MFIPKIFNIAVNLNSFVCRWTAQKGAAYYGVTSVIFFEMADFTGINNYRIYASVTYLLIILWELK